MVLRLSLHGSSGSHLVVAKGFPGGSDCKESACSAGVQVSIPGKISWRREWLPTPVFLPEEFHGQRSLVGYSRWDRKELDTTECLTHTHTHTHNPTTHTSAGSPSFQLPHNPHLSGVILYIRMRVHMSSALGSASWGPQPRHHHTLTPQCASPGQTYLEL